MIHLYFLLLPSLFFFNEKSREGLKPELTSAEKFSAVSCQIIKDMLRIVCLHLGCVCSSVNKFANCETDIKKMALSHADDLQSLQFREERRGCEIKSGENRREGSPRIPRSHLQSAFSLLPSFQKHLDVQASRPEEEWRHSGMDF